MSLIAGRWLPPCEGCIGDWKNFVNSLGSSLYCGGCAGGGVEPVGGSPVSLDLTVGNMRVNSPGSLVGEWAGGVAGPVEKGVAEEGGVDGIA